MLNELDKRRKAYKEFAGKFSFFFNITNIPIEEITTAARLLISMYPVDLDNSLIDLCVHFKNYIEVLNEDVPRTAMEMCKMIREKDLTQIFPYVDIALRIFLCTPCTNCSAERSFSALKRIKTYLRSSIAQDRLDSLAVLCIESDLTISIDFDELLIDFAEAKVRRKNCT